MKDAGFCCCVKYIDGSVCRHCRVEGGKGRFEELVGVLVIQIVVLDLPGGTFQSHKIRRVRTDKVDFLTAEQPLVCLRKSGISADNTVLAEMPDITRARDARSLKLCFHIKIIFLCFTVIQ